MGKLKFFYCLIKSSVTLPSNKMSAALFGSITMAVTRAAVAAPVAAVAAAASPPRRSMSGDGKTQEGTVTPAGDSFAKKETVEEAKYFNKLQAEQLEKLKKEKEAEESEKSEEKVQ